MAGTIKSLVYFFLIKKLNMKEILSEVLGVLFSCDEKLNLKTILSKVLAISKTLWKQGDLALQNKIIIIKTLAVPLINLLQ